jgi:hypothetical protein
MKAAFVLLAALTVASCAATGHAADEHHAHAAPAMPDTREAVRFPPMLREHTLANMRDHLATMQALQEALAAGNFDHAAHLAETRLGLSSLEAHGAHDVAPYMPAAMQAMGAEMHKAASRFAVEATNASATGDVRPALAALADVTARCVACHAAYRFEK